MFVTFSWPRALPLGKSAAAVVQAIEDSGRLEKGLLKPLASLQDLDPALGSCEVLQMELRGLSSSFYLMPIFGLFNISMWQKVEDTVDLLREFIGVEPRVLVNGNQSVLSYAAQEEYRARRFREALDEAKEAVKGTRKWLRDPRVAEIRQQIERRVEDADKGAALEGFSRVLVFEEKAK